MGIKVTENPSGENMLKGIICWIERNFFQKKLDKPKHNRLIEEHAGLLKKTQKGTSLYKIVSLHYFCDMIKNDYLYFTRVDTYSDDSRDSDLPDRDKEIGKKSRFVSDPNSSIVDHYEICRSKTYACCFSTENTDERIRQTSFASILIFF